MSEELPVNALATSLQDDSLNDSESESLRSLIESDFEAREQLVAHLMVSAALQEHFGLVRPDNQDQTPTQSYAGGGYSSMRLAALVAFCLISVLSFFLILTHQSDSLKKGDVVLARIDEAVWRSATPELHGSLTSSPLELLSGLARVDFRSGATVSIKGPALFELLSNDTVRLNHGEIVAFVPQSAVGFRVHTPEFEVVDLGTAFGLKTDPILGSSLNVFEGKVRVEDAHSPPVVLEEGETVTKSSTDVSFKLDQELPFNDFEDLWSMTSGILDASGKIRIVSPGPDFMPGRFQDDDNILVFTERLGIDVKAETSLYLEKQEAHVVPLWSSKSLEPSHRVRSYLVQFEPATPGRDKRFLSGTITFDKPVIGIIASGGALLETDSAFGHPNGSYDRPFGRGVELERPGVDSEKVRDQVRLLEDQRTIEVEFSARGGSNIDQMRILVQDD